ncbi:methyltransferase family protein [Marinobacterium aestuariivivens]|uniref:Methyltransferase family protein n=1 Tax=Marinobacterium aestuariivivens TaxID=1698799 RepID=A0ABW2A1C0_9GAMM
MERKIPPLILVLLWLLCMGVLSALLPSPSLVFEGHIGLAVLLGMAGFAVALTGVLHFRRAGTTLNPVAPEDASALVTSGIYRYSRNPMYLGFLLWLAAAAVWLAHLAAFALLPVFVLYLNRFQIEPEERALGRIFGESFADYCRRVRRWI